MAGTRKFIGVTLGALLAFAASSSAPKPALALTAELAKTCRQMAMKAIPSARASTSSPRTYPSAWASAVFLFLGFALPLYVLNVRRERRKECPDTAAILPDTAA